MPFPGIYQQKEDGTIEASGASRIVVDVLKPLLVGEDPLDTERLWEMMFRLNITWVGLARAGGVPKS